MFKIHTSINRLLQMCRLGILLLFLSSCVEEYVLPNDIATQYTEQLYITGSIASGSESVFHLSKTEALDYNGREKSVTDAVVKIIGENGYVSGIAETDGDGTYTIRTEKLQESRYKVSVVVDGEVYESEYQSILHTPALQHVGFTEIPGKETVNIHVTTKGTENSPRKYMWTFDLDYEFHALLDLRAVKYVDKYVIVNLQKYPRLSLESNPYYYCWKHEESTTIQIYDTESLTNNEVREHVIHSIGIDQKCLTSLCAITVHQYSLSDEGYVYYRKMEKSTQDVGGLFSEMPSEFFGNVHCLSNPKRKVRGFVSASTVSSYRIFITPEDLEQRLTFNPEKDKVQICQAQTASEEAAWAIRSIDAWNSGGGRADEEYGKMTRNSWILLPVCFDCLLDGGTKDKPEWWPNDHE